MFTGKLEYTKRRSVTAGDYAMLILNFGKPFSNSRVVSREVRTTGIVKLRI